MGKKGEKKYKTKNWQTNAAAFLAHIWIAQRRSEREREREEEWTGQWQFYKVAITVLHLTVGAVAATAATKSFDNKRFDGEYKEK